MIQLTEEEHAELVARRRLYDQTTAGVIAGELLAKELIASKDYERVRDILLFHAAAGQTQSGGRS